MIIGFTLNKNVQQLNSLSLPVIGSVFVRVRVKGRKEVSSNDSQSD